MKINTLKAIILFTIVLVIIILKYTGITEYFTFEDLKNNKEHLRNFVKQNYFESVLLYFCVYILVVSLSIPGAAVLSLAGGYLFGTIPGAVYVNFGATIGSGIVFLLCRYLLGEWIQERYKDKLARFNDEINKNGQNYLLTLRLIPVFPFFLINILASLTTVPFTTFIWTTSAGILPASLVYTFAGSQLNNISSLRDILSPKILLSFLLLAFIAFIPVIWNKIKYRGNRKNVY
ncbi:MAG: TVP38/TMEM64 family protein [bacterium]